MLVPQNLYNTVSSPKFVTYMGIGSAEIRIDIRQIKDIDSMTAQIAAALGKRPTGEKNTQSSRPVPIRRLCRMADGQSDG